MHRVELTFSEEEMLCFLAKKNIKAFEHEFLQFPVCTHGSNFIELEPIKDWAVLYDKKLLKMTEVFDKILKMELMGYGHKATLKAITSLHEQ